MNNQPTNNKKATWWDNLSPEEREAHQAKLQAGQQRRRDYINQLIEAAGALNKKPRSTAVDSKKAE